MVIDINIRSVPNFGNHNWNIMTKQLFRINTRVKMIDGKFHLRYRGKIYKKTAEQLDDMCQITRYQNLQESERKSRIRAKKRRKLI